MRTFFFLIIVIALTNIVIADQLAMTKDGRKVILYDDGTWAYYTEARKDTTLETDQESVVKEESKKEKPNLTTWDRVDHIYVNGEILGYEDPADVVFEILKRNGIEKICEPDVPGDGTVTHHYKINNKYVNITFKRSYGQYRVTKIWIKK